MSSERNLFKSILLSSSGSSSTFRPSPPRKIINGTTTTRDDAFDRSPLPSSKSNHHHHQSHQYPKILERPVFISRVLSFVNIASQSSSSQQNNNLNPQYSLSKLAKLASVCQIFDETIFELGTGTRLLKLFLLMISFAFSNNGAGMAESHLVKILEKCIRSEASIYWTRRLRSRIIFGLILANSDVDDEGSSIFSSLKKTFESSELIDKIQNLPLSVSTSTKEEENQTQQQHQTRRSSSSAVSLAASAALSSFSFSSSSSSSTTTGTPSISSPYIDVIGMGTQLWCYKFSNKSISTNSSIQKQRQYHDRLICRSLWPKKKNNNNQLNNDIDEQKNRQEERRNDDDTVAEKEKEKKDEATTISISTSLMKQSNIFISSTNCCSFSNNGKLLAVGHSGSRISILEVNTGRLLAHAEIGVSANTNVVAKTVTSIFWSKSDSFLFCLLTKSQTITILQLSPTQTSSSSTDPNSSNNPRHLPNLQIEDLSMKSQFFGPQTKYAKGGGSRIISMDYCCASSVSENNNNNYTNDNNNGDHVVVKNHNGGGGAAAGYLLTSSAASLSGENQPFITVWKFSEMFSESVRRTTTLHMKLVFQRGIYSSSSSVNNNADDDDEQQQQSRNGLFRTILHNRMILMSESLIRVFSLVKVTHDFDDDGFVNFDIVYNEIDPNNFNEVKEEGFSSSSSATHQKKKSSSSKPQKLPFGGKHPFLEKMPKEDDDEDSSADITSSSSYMNFDLKQEKSETDNNSFKKKNNTNKNNKLNSDNNHNNIIAQFSCPNTGQGGVNDEKCFAVSPTMTFYVPNAAPSSSSASSLSAMATTSRKEPVFMPPKNSSSSSNMLKNLNILAVSYEEKESDQNNKIKLFAFDVDARCLLLSSKSNTDNNNNKNKKLPSSSLSSSEVSLPLGETVLLMSFFTKSSSSSSSNQQHQLFLQTLLTNGDLVYWKILPTSTSSTSNNNSSSSLFYATLHLTVPTRDCKVRSLKPLTGAAARARLLPSQRATTITSGLNPAGFASSSSASSSIAIVSFRRAEVALYSLSVVESTELGGQRGLLLIDDGCGGGNKKEKDDMMGKVQEANNGGTFGLVELKDEGETEEDEGTDGNTNDHELLAPTSSSSSSSSHDYLIHVKAVKVGLNRWKIVAQTLSGKIKSAVV